MTLKSSNLNWLYADNIQQIFKLLAQNGGEGRIVGGAVRDHLLNVTIGDIDFCSTHTPDALIALAQKNNIRYIETGIQYGTLTLMLGGQAFEVTSLRQDIDSDGRHAKVIYSTDFKQDAARRDFTFNALYMTMNGEIIDELGGGIADAIAKNIKFIGNASKRIEEDYLRILRYFRFISRFGLNINDGDYQQIPAMVAGLNQLSAERLLAEFKRIYKGEHLLHALMLMNEVGIFKQLFMMDAQLNKLVYFDKYKADFDQKWLILMALSLPNVDHKLLSKKLKLSKVENKVLSWIENLPKLLRLTEQQLAVQIYKQGKAAICVKVFYDAANANYDLIELALKLHFIDAFIIPKLPVKGADLLAKGMQAGRALGAELKRLEQHWLEHDFKPNKNELLALSFTTS